MNIKVLVAKDDVNPPEYIEVIDNKCHVYNHPIIKVDIDSFQIAEPFMIIQNFPYGTIILRHSDYRWFVEEEDVEVQTTRM